MIALRDAMERTTTSAVTIRCITSCAVPAKPLALRGNIR